MATPTPKKRAFRKLIRLTDGMLAIRFFDVATGAMISDLTGYDIISGGGFGGTLTPPTTPTQPEQQWGDGSGEPDGSLSPSDNFWSDWGQTSSTGSRDVIADLRATVENIQNARDNLIGSVLDKTPWIDVPLPAGAAERAGTIIQQGIRGIDALGDATDKPATSSAPTAQPSGRTPMASELSGNLTQGQGLSIPKEAPGTRVDNSFIDYANIETRRIPVSDYFTERMGAALNAVDPSLGIVITSAGQPSAEQLRNGPFTVNGESYSGRTGSTRHDINKDGKADTADFYLTRDGQPLSLGGKDRETYLEVAKAAAAVGFTGIGHYENMNVLHIGMGAPASWGPGRTVKTLAPDFAKAINDGRQLAASGVGNQLIENYKQSAPLTTAPIDRSKVQPVDLTTPGFSGSRTPINNAIPGPGVDPRVVSAMGTIASKLGTGLSATGGIDMRVNDTNAFTKTGQGLAGTVQMPRDVTPTLNPNYVKPSDGFMGNVRPDVSRPTTQTTVQSNPTSVEAVRSNVPAAQAPVRSLDPIVNYANNIAPAPTPYSSYPMEGARRDAVIRTVMGEAAGEGLLGMTAVANVIYNRSIDPRYPSDPFEVVTQKNAAGIHQFSAFNTPSMGGNALINKSVDSPEYQRAAKVVDAVFGGLVPDITGGATHYHTKDVNPNWGKAGIPGTENIKGAITIGNHILYPRGELDTIPRLDDNMIATLMTRDPITGRIDSGLMDAPMVSNRVTQPSGPEDSSFYSAPSPFSSPSRSISQPSGPEDSSFYGSGYSNGWPEPSPSSQPSGPEDSGWMSASNPFSSGSSSGGSRNNAQPSGPEDSGFYDSGYSNAWPESFGNSSQPSGPEDSGFYSGYSSGFMSDPSPSPSTTSPSSGSSGGRSSGSSSGSSGRDNSGSGYNAGINNYGSDYDYI